MICVCALQACPLCDLDVLSASGSCMPGAYLLTYSAVNDDGLSASATRQLFVYQAVAATIPLQLYSGIASLSQAAGLVSGLRNASLPGYATGVDDSIQKLGTLAAQVEPGDVDIVDAAYVQHSPTDFSIHVNVTVYLYTPRSVHRQDVLAFDRSWMSATGPGGQRRRHLLSATGAPTVYSLQPQASGASQEALAPAESGSGIINQRREAAAALENLKQSLALLDDLLAPAEAADVAESWLSQGDGPTRRLLQSSGDADLAAVLALLSQELGTNVTSQSLTAQAVDLLTVSSNTLRRIGLGCEFPRHKWGATGVTAV